MVSLIIFPCNFDHFCDWKRLIVCIHFPVHLLILYITPLGEMKNELNHTLLSQGVHFLFMESYPWHDKPNIHIGKTCIAPAGRHNSAREYHDPSISFGNACQMICWHEYNGRCVSTDMDRKLYLHILVIVSERGLPLWQGRSKRGWNRQTWRPDCLVSEADTAAAPPTVQYLTEMNDKYTRCHHSHIFAQTRCVKEIKIKILHLNVHCFFSNIPNLPKRLNFT